MASTSQMGAGLIVQVVTHAPIIRTLQEESLDRKMLERRLDLSSATGYRYTGWLCDLDLIEDSDGTFRLTALGDAVTKESSEFAASIHSILQPTRDTREDLVKIVGIAPVINAFYKRPLDRRDLERELDVSKSSSYRYIRLLDNLDLLDRSGKTYTLTDAGEEVAEIIERFRTNVLTAFQLGPVLEAVQDITPQIDIEWFADATVRTPERGDAHSPVNRFISLIEETKMLRCIDSNSIAPLYLSDIQHRIVDGMVTEDILTPSIVTDILSEYPDKCVEACASGHLTVYLHYSLPFSLVILDDTVGLGVRDPSTRGVQTYVDTESPAARKWAEAVYESYRSEAVEMDGFGPKGFRNAIESEALDPAATADLPEIDSSIFP